MRSCSKSQRVIASYCSPITQLNKQTVLTGNGARLLHHGKLSFISIFIFVTKLYIQLHLKQTKIAKKISVGVLSQINANIFVEGNGRSRSKFVFINKNIYLSRILDNSNSPIKDV